MLIILLHPAVNLLLVLLTMIRSVLSVRLLWFYTRFNFNFNKFSMLMKIEAAYNYGIMDTFSKMEHDGTTPPVNVNAYNTTGKRLTRGLECCISIGIPLKFAEKDACSNFKDLYYYNED